MRRQCETCQYLQYCFWGLKFFKLYLSDTPCLQRRKIKEMKHAATTTDTQVA